jgi:hypothetical protein
MIYQNAYTLVVAALSLHDGIQGKTFGSLCDHRDYTIYRIYRLEGMVTVQ